MNRTLLRIVVLLAGGVTLAGCSTDPEVAKREYVRSGNAYVEQGKYNEAIIEYKNAVQQDARFGEAHLKLAQAYLKVGDLGGAAQEFVIAADLLPENVEAQLKAGEMLLLAKQFDDARARADNALALHPRLMEAQVLRANALAGLKKLDEAVAEIEDAIRNDPTRAANYANLGVFQLVRGERTRAEAAFRQAVDTDPRSIIARLALGNFYLSANRRAEAESELRAAVAVDPRHPLANRALALLLIGTGRGPQAEPYLQALADAAPDASGKLILADYYLAQQRPEKAQAVLREAAATKGGFVVATLRLAALSASSRDLNAAVQYISEVLAKEPSNAKALSARANVELLQGKLDEALATSRAAIQADPQLAHAHFTVGRVQAARRQLTEAETAYTEALRLDPRYAPAEVELARVYLLGGRLTQARRLAESAVGKASSYADASLLLARIHLQAGEPDKAEPLLRSLSQALPNSPAVQIQVGELELAHGNRAGARAAFERAIAEDADQFEALVGLVQVDLLEKKGTAAQARIDAALKNRPGDSNLLVLAGRTRAAFNDFTAAESLFKQALEADPNNLDGYAMLANLYYTQERLDEARLQYERLGEKQPKSVPVHTTIGLLLQAMNRPADARAKYEHVLRIDPTAAVAANNLAWIYIQQNGNLDMALSYAQAAKAQLPDHPEVNDTLGWIYVKKGLPELAIAPLLRSVEKDPKNASYQFHLGMAYAGVPGVPDAAKARTALSKALALNLSMAEAAEARKALSALEGS